MNTLYEEAVETANQLDAAASSWADLHNALFDQESGVLAKVFPTRESRAAFLASDEYKQISAILAKARSRTGLVKGAEPTKSGKLLVRIPKSMHSALESEAKEEGVSLNHLVVAKLSVQLQKFRGNPKLDWVPLIVQAFAEVRNGASEDRVVADPELNSKFLDTCRQLGVVASDAEINKKLFYVRKRGFTTNLPSVARFRIPRSRMDSFQFASEMALRFVQRKEMESAWREVSLDSVICDPILAAAFDSYAARLAPGFTPFEYRWAALSLRKAGRYMKEALNLDVPIFQDMGLARRLHIDNVPDVQGLYVVRNSGATVFVGETMNLRSRIRRHLDVSGARLLPNWLYSGDDQSTSLGVFPMPAVSEALVKALELRAILALSPTLNYARAA